MITVWAETTVSAAHIFNGHALHGHTYIVRLSVHAPVDAEALHADLAEMRKGVDHRCLNDVLPEPTMEAMALWFAELAGKRYRVAEVAISRAEGMGCRLVAPSP